MYLHNELTLHVSSCFMYLLSFVLDNWLTKQSTQSSTSRVFLPTKHFDFFFCSFNGIFFSRLIKHPSQWCLIFYTFISHSLKCNHTAVSTRYWNCLTLLDEVLSDIIRLANIWMWTLHYLRDQAGFWELWIKVFTLTFHHNWPKQCG
jgi:hypothetical protein